ncbi:Tonsoku-like protein [Hypsibius exemplaris]|uniref:Tonsoku-like protein n=1 Tax=Hypsibius exemplaris TaxID=2072580 RepID=A0A1W0WS82_HYPEX|nr:Tonsoku-like protein [Hypsibius exemplaris]
MGKKTGLKAEIEALSRDKQTNLHKGRYEEVAKICNYLGELLTREERYEDAISEHETELEMCEKTRDRMGKAVANRKIGECLCAMGDYEKALRFQQKHLTIARDLNSDLEQQRAHATIGRTYMCRAEGTDELRDSVQKAREAFNASLNFAVVLKGEMEPAEYALMVGRIYLNLGILAEMSGSMLRAVKHLKEARAMMKDSKLPEEELKCVSMLASVSLNLGELEPALDLAQMSYTLAKQVRNRTAIAEALVLRAGIALESEKFIEARHCLKKVLKAKSGNEEFRPRARKMLSTIPKLQAALRQLATADPGEDDRIKLLDALADRYCSVECYFTALRFYRQTLEAAKAAGKSASELAVIYVSLTQTSVDLKNFADAIRYSREEIKLRNDPGQRCRTWLNIADYVERKEGGGGGSGGGDATMSIVEIGQRALAEAEKSGRSRLILESLRYLQAVYRGLGDVDKVDEMEDRMRTVMPVDEDSESDVESEGKSRASSPDTEDFSSLTESDGDIDAGEEKSNASMAARRGGQYKVRRNEKGETLLHTAVINGSLKRVKQLIAAGHPVNERDNCGWLPIHEAANHNHLEIATYLIEHNASLNDRGLKGCNGLTPMLDAAYSGNLDMVRLLFNRGAVVTAKDGDGKTVVDALMAWRKENFTDVRQSMDAQTQTQFDELVGSLQAAMIQSGMRPDQLRNSDGPANQSSGSKTRPPSGLTGSKCNTDPRSSRVGRSPSPDIHADGAKSYQAAIDGVKGTSFRRRQEKRKRALSPVVDPTNDALVRSEEFVGDDWLIEDVTTSDGPHISREAGGLLFTSGVRCPTEKRKPSSFVKPASRTSTLSRKTPATGIEDHDIVCLDGTKPSRSGVDLEFIEPEPDWQRNLPASSGSSSTTSLLRPPSPAISTTSSTPILVPPVTSVVAPAPPPQPTSIGRMRVRIEELVIIVPIAQGHDRTIGWLAEEAAVRYCNMKGIKPVLQLKTSDGAVLSTVDLVRDVVAQSEDVVGFPLSWHNPPVRERYAKCCAAAGVPEMRNLRQALVTACETGVLCLSDLNVTASSAGPVFNSLQFQSNIRQINLEANPIGDAAFQILLAVLPSLPNLTHLGLANTDLTNNSLDALKRLLITHQASSRSLQFLSELNLSHNDFSDDGMGSLTDIVSELPCLTALTLDDCGFTRCFLDRQEDSFRAAFAKLPRLRSVSFAWNNLEAEGVARLLSVLPANVKPLHYCTTF